MVSNLLNPFFKNIGRKHLNIGRCFWPPTPHAAHGRVNPHFSKKRPFNPVQSPRSLAPLSALRLRRNSGNAFQISAVWSATTQMCFSRSASAKFRCCSRSPSPSGQIPTPWQNSHATTARTHKPSVLCGTAIGSAKSCTPAFGLPTRSAAGKANLHVFSRISPHETSFPIFRHRRSGPGPDALPTRTDPLQAGPKSSEIPLAA